MSDEQTHEDEPIHTFDWAGADNTSMAVVGAVAAARDCDPVDFDPLHSAVDTEALDALFPTDSFSGSPIDGRIDFAYLDYRVTIDSDGCGYLHEREATGSKSYTDGGLIGRVSER